MALLLLTITITITTHRSSRNRNNDEPSHDWARADHQHPDWASAIARVSMIVFAQRTRSGTQRTGHNGTR